MADGRRASDGGESVIRKLFARSELSECMACLSTREVLAFCGASQAARSSASLPGSWEGLKRTAGSAVDFDSLRRAGCALGGVAKAISVWHERITTLELPPPVAKAAALTALRRLPGAAAGALPPLAAASFQLVARREVRFKPFPYADCDRDRDPASDPSEPWEDGGEGELVAWDAQMAGYGRVTQRVASRLSLGGYKFCLEASCEVEVDSRNFSCRETGHVTCREARRLRGKRPPARAPGAVFVEWSAADDEEEDAAFRPGELLRHAAADLGVEVTLLARVVFTLLASPFRLCGPPHPYVFGMGCNWEMRLLQLMQGALGAEEDHSGDEESTEGQLQ